MKRKIARIFLELMRHHVTVMAIMAAVNMALIITGSKYIIYFSALLPQLLASNGFSLALSSGYAPLETISIVLGGIFIVLLLLGVAFSYKKRGWFIVSAALVAADLSLAFIMFFRDGNLSFLPDMIINGYILLVTVGAFFVMGALYPKAVVEVEDDPAAVCDVSDEFTAGYGEYSSTCLCEQSEEEPEELHVEDLPACVEQCDAPAEKIERGELDDGVILKITFRVPTLKTIKEALFGEADACNEDDN